MSDFTDLERTAPYFGVGQAAEHGFGVLYQGEFETPGDGTAVAVRAHARALADRGLPVRLKSFSGFVTNGDGVPEPVMAVGMPPEVRAEVGDLIDASIAVAAVMVKHLVVRNTEMIERILLPRQIIHADPDTLLKLRRAVRESTIAYTVWERDRVSRTIADELRRLGELWVPCVQNKTALVRSGIPSDLVHVMPHPYDPKNPVCRLTTRAPRPGRRRFYSIGRWEPRKGYRELLFAFLGAFTPKDDVTLTIKTNNGNWPGYPGARETLEEAKRRFRHWGTEIEERVQIVTRREARNGILALHYHNNIYVQSSHGEAWGLPAFEAKLAGNRLVHVPFGGTEDYAEDDDIRVEHAMGPVPTSYNWEPDAEWAVFREEALVEALERATPPAVFARSPSFEERFSHDVIGRAMAERVVLRAEALHAVAGAALRAKLKP